MIIHGINIIGAGSLGSYTAQILTKMNQTWQCPIRVWDFDKVEGHNISNQIYAPKDVGRSKVSALSKVIKNLGGQIKINESVVNEKTDLRGLVIVAVDSMKARQEIFEACKFNWAVDYYIEARMGGHLGMIFGLDPKNSESIDRYSQYFYASKDVANPICATNETLPALWYVAASIAQLVRLYRQSVVLKETYTEGIINMHGQPVVNFDAYVLI